MDLAERINKWLSERHDIAIALCAEGPTVIKRLMEKSTLRDIARRSGLSPTYLSQVLNGHAVISPRAFLALDGMDTEKPAL